MSRTTSYIILLLVALAGIVYFLIPDKEERVASYKTEPVVVVVDSASVVKIEIQRPGKSVSMENIGGRWMMTSPITYAADDNGVKQVISGMAKFKPGSLISSNPEKQTVFQVDTNGTKLTLTERGGKSVSLVIGKMGPSYSEVYFRQPGSKDVYLGEGIDSWTINKEVKEWRDKTITSFPSEAISNLSYTLGNKHYEFHRDSSIWKSGEKTLDMSLINPALASLSDFRADDFIDTAAALQGQPVRVSVKAGEDINLNLYPAAPDSSKYYVQKSSSNQVFIVGKYAIQQLLKPTEQTSLSSRHVPVVAEEPVIEQPKKEEPKEEVAKKETAEPEVQKKETIAKETPKEIVKEPAQEVQKTVPQNDAAKTGEPPVSTEESRKKLIERALSAKKQPGTKLRDRTATTLPQKEENKVAEPAASAPPQEQKQATTELPKPASVKTEPAVQQNAQADEEGDLTVHTVAKGETMQLIAKKYSVTVEQILKWNLLKSIAVRPGQELYIYAKK